MKKLLFSLSLLASLATLAGESTIEATAQVYGTLTISSTSEKVIVSVPWVAASNTETNSISVAEIIKTANLTEGDWIRSWDQSNDRFNVWELKKVNEILVWTAVKTVSPSGTTETADSDATFLKRGDALVLYRKNAATQPLFYVNGQYKELTTSDQTSVASAVGSTPAYTLIAPPVISDTALNLNTGVTWVGEPGSKDMIYYGGTSTGGLFYQLKKIDEKWTWGYWDDEFMTDATVPANGTGFWYKSVTNDNSSASLKIQWVKSAE